MRTVSRLLGRLRPGKSGFSSIRCSRSRTLAVACEAALVGEREVTSSSGERECRRIISTTLRVGRREWPIELGLTNREGLVHRMLLGRQAILPGMLVDPARSFLLPKLSTRLYRTPA